MSIWISWQYMINAPWFVYKNCNYTHKSKRFNKEHLAATKLLGITYGSIIRLFTNKCHGIRYRLSKQKQKKNINKKHKNWNYSVSATLIMVFTSILTFVDSVAVTLLIHSHTQQIASHLCVFLFFFSSDICAYRICYYHNNLLILTDADKTNNHIYAAINHVNSAQSFAQLEKLYIYISTFYILFFYLYGLHNKNNNNFM